LCIRLHKNVQHNNLTIILNKKPTIQDIARELKVTPSTVSRALNDHPRISVDTKKAVNKVATKLNYQPNHVASALRKGNTNLIGVIVPRIDSAFFSSIIRGVEGIALNKGYNVLVAQSNEDIEREKSVIKSFINARIAGVFVSLGKNTTEFNHYEEAQKLGVPVMQFDRTTSKIDSSQVVIDDYRGGYDATNHLIEMGCKNIVHLTSLQSNNIYKERQRGYIDALVENSIDINESLIIKGDMLQEQGIAAVSNILSKGSYDAIFSSSDYSALGALQVLKEKKIKIPEEVCVVGFSNEKFTDLVEPSLSTVNQFPETMGKTATELFFNQIELNTTDTVPHKIVLQPNLIIRDSSNRKKT